MKQQLIRKHSEKEIGFYRIYFEILNINSTKKLTKRELQLLSIICSKPMQYTLFKRNPRNTADNKTELAKELGVSINQVSNLIRPLIQRGIMLTNEEEEFVLNENITLLRKTIKDNLKNGDFEFDYTLNFKITNNE